MSINKILTSQYQDLSQEEIANLQHTLGPVIGGGLEGYWRPEVSQLGNLTWTWSNASTATPPAGMNIKGDKGDPGQDGTNGKRPVIRVNSENAHWEWKYYEDTTPYIDLGVVASGEQGPQGKDGYSIDLQSISAGQGGNLITLQWGDPTDLSTSSFFLPSGVAGVSPTVTTNELSPTEQHPQGGTAVTITDGTGSETINIWNGNNGAGATVRLLEGTGIKIEANGTDYTVSVSADYALKSELPDLTPYATQTWVGQQGYLTSIPNTYALKTDVEAASANALSEAESWVENKHYLTSVPDSYATKTYANDASANALSQAETWVETEGYLKAVPDSYATKDYANETSAYALSQAKTWVDEQDFLHTSGGTVSGQLIMSATRGTFDDNYIKCINDGNDGYSRFGVGRYGGAVIKAVDGSNNPVQVNVRYNTNNNELILVQKSNADVGYLIPAQIHQGSYTPTTADGILHIVLESN